MSAVLALALLVPGAAAAQDKSKSPASSEISDMDYVCKEVVRVSGLSGWEKEKGKIEFLEASVKECEDAVAKVKKKDPKWDVSSWEKTLADAKGRAKKAKDALGSAPPPAPAGPDPSKSPAYDDIVLTQGQLGPLQKKLADTTDWGADKDKRESARTAIQGFESGIKRIQSKDPKWDLSAWLKILADAQARLKTADGAVAKQEAGDKAAHDLYQDYYWKMSKVQDALALLGELQSKPDGVKIESEQIFGKWIESLVAVDVLDKACKEKKYEKVNPIPADYKTYKPVAADGCKTAAAWKDLAKKYVELQARGAAKREAERLAKRIDAMKAGNPIEAADHASLLDPQKHIEFFKKTYDKGASQVGATVDVAWFEPIKAISAKYGPALDEAGKTNRWDKAFALADAALAAAIAADHKKGGQLPEGDVLKTGSLADWTVEKDVWNVPVKRTKNANALVKIKGEGYCRLYSRGFEEKYNAGQWGQPFWYTAGATFVVSACK